MLRINSKQQKAPKRIGRYSILETLGRGASGTVYKAYDPFVQRHVAIKYSSDLSQIEDRQARDRVLRSFFREAYAAGNLHHPNIVSLYDAGMQGSHSYIVMEFVEGVTLKSYAKEAAPVDLASVINIVTQCCKALDYAHEKGVIHRDIKPSNMLIASDGHIKLADFSIANVSRSDDTQIIGLTGSPMYMSPEVIREEVAGPQSDIYSLGVVMYELLTGETPFSPGNMHSVMYQILNHEAKPVTRLRLDLPERLSEIVSKCLSKSLSQRYQYGYELERDLEVCVSAQYFQEEKIGDREKRKMLSKLAFFAGFHEEEVDGVHKVCQWYNYHAGQAIVNEGSTDDGFYILALGSVDIRKGTILLDTLNAGECFGEMGVLNDVPRSASVVAKSFILLMKITAEALESTSASCQMQFYKKFAQTLSQRLVSSNERCIESTLNQDKVKKQTNSKAANDKKKPRTIKKQQVKDE
ncbi:MAG: serine/threonine-protein kinase [Gammaproteobacteria bacterium]|nr:serine/threonine-protein kinase [Gammaproteobacteria bacterium]